MSSVLLWAAAVLFAVTGLYYLWILFCVFVGLLTEKRAAPPAEPKRFAVLSCARNEEAVIAPLVSSILQQDYPPELRQMFVIAHNCTDDTALRASEAGAEVFVRNDPSDRCKGDALRFGIRELLARHPGEFDFVAVFDADNLASPGFLREMNAALQNGADVVQGFRASKNERRNRVTQLFSAFWLAMSDFQYLAHTRLGLPSCVNGTGFAFRLDALPPEGWQTFTFLEDVEFSVQQLLLGHKVRSAPAAVFYDEQPATLRDGLRQRFRWAVGMEQTMRRYAPRLLRALPERGAGAMKVLGDICINPLFRCTILGLLALLAGLSIRGAVLRQILLGVAMFLAGLWVLSLPLALALLWKERKPLSRNLATVFWFAPFLFLSFVFGVAAVFVRHPKWTPIRHEDTAVLSELEAGRRR